MAAPGGLRWMNIYPFKDPKLTEYTIRKAEKLGFKALVVTVDSPVPGLDRAMEDLFEQDHMLNHPSYRYVNPLTNGLSYSHRLNTGTTRFRKAKG